MDYKIPEPSENPNASLVMIYKIAKEFEFDDRSWDKKHWSRSAKSAEELLEICKTYEIARRCIEELAQKFKQIGCDWNFSTITNHSHDWKQRRGKNDGKNRARFLDALTKQRTNSTNENQGELASAGEMLDSVGIIQVIRGDLGNQGRKEGGSNGSVGKRISPDGMEAKEA